VTLLGHAAPLAVTAGDYLADGQGLIMIAETSVTGDFSLWRAAAPAGPWREIQTGRVPCTKGTQPGSSALCRALIGHPELSTRAELLMSFFDPGDNHVEVTTFPW
jgi:hypothetical protein